VSPPASVPELAVRSHRSWHARTDGGGHGDDDLFITAPPGGEGHLLFPRHQTGDALSKAITWQRDQGVVSIGCWSLLPEETANLGAILLARGFQWGWQPHWMGLDLRPGPPDVPPYDGATIDDEEDGRFVARANGDAVGKVTVHIDGAEAGIYDCAVEPEFRRRGLGAALTATACRLAASRGCTDVTLNATPMGRPVYQRIGFESDGSGQTWWLHQAVLAQWPPPEDDVHFLEAVGSGRTDDLDPAANLDRRRPCGKTPMEIAAITNQAASAHWLEDHGATVDLISAWDLGWRDRLRELATAYPDIINRRAGEFEATPMHAAVMRGDAELAAALLELGPDLSAKDGNWKSTPLEWTKAVDQPEIAKLIEAHRR
jgi:GNAT superfamily N-acetyltransferase